MRNCDDMREVLGLYVDGELPPEARAAVEEHVCACESCQCELRTLQQLGEQIGGAGSSVCVPSELWSRIEAQLEARPAHGRLSGFLRLRPIIAAAACLLLGVGGYMALTQVPMEQRADAASVNFSVLLDGLSVDAEKAFLEFVQLYKGRRVSPSEARHHASQLNFAMPETLPVGFKLDEAFALQIGDAPAAAATYRREGEFIGTVFHRAIHPEDYGTHRDHPCVVGEHRGHQVQVGEWRLVHVTDLTTCHCVLSKLDELTQLPPILRAVAPDSQPTDHSHP